MIQSILLENFLAHKKTEVLLGPGMTVLTGANNCGKSAVVEGLRCVSQNPDPRHFIRHGAREARVTVTVDHGIKVTWIRKKATVIYEILRPGATEPEVFRKIRRGQVPEEVLDLLRLDRVILESGDARSKKVDVHIGNQRNPIFLLGDHSADARMAEFFVASTEGAHLLSMQKLLKNKMREARSAATSASQRMAALEQDLDQLAPLPDLERQLLLARELEAEVNRSNRQLPELEEVLTTGTRLDAAHRQCEARGQVLAQLSDPPLVHDTPALAQVEQETRQLAQRIAHGRQRLSALDILSEPPELLPTQEMVNAVQSLNTVAAQIAAHDTKVAALLGLSEPPELLPTQGIVDTVQSLNSLASQIKTYDKKATVLLGLSEPPELFDEQPLAGLLRDIEQARVRAEQLGKVLEGQELNLERLKNDIAHRAKEIGNCPLCNNKLDAEALLGGGE